MMSRRFAGLKAGADYILPACLRSRQPYLSADADNCSCPHAAPCGRVVEAVLEMYWLNLPLCGAPANNSARRQRRTRDRTGHTRAPCAPVRQLHHIHTCMRLALPLSAAAGMVTGPTLHAEVSREYAYTRST